MRKRIPASSLIITGFLKWRIKASVRFFETVSISFPSIISETGQEAAGMFALKVEAALKRATVLLRCFRVQAMRLMQKRIRKRIKSRERKKSLVASSVSHGESLNRGLSCGAASCKPIKREMADKRMMVRVRDASWLKRIVRMRFTDKPYTIMKKEAIAKVLLPPHEN